jgi:hypothetical protein
MATDAPQPRGSEDSGLQTFKNIRSRLEQAVGGQGLFNVGLGDWTYPIQYNAQDVPPALDKKKWAEALGLETQGPRVQLTEEDVRVMKDKQDKMDEAMLHETFFKVFHPMDDPVRMMILKKAWPEPFERMKEMIVKRAELQKEVQTKLLDDIDKDSILMRLAITQNPEFQHEILHTPIGPVPLGKAEAEQNERVVQFQRGFMNPHHLRRLDDTGTIMQASRQVADQLSGISGPEATAGRPTGYTGEGFFGSSLYGTYVPDRKGAYPQIVPVSEIARKLPTQATVKAYKDKATSEWRGYNPTFGETQKEQQAKWEAAKQQWKESTPLSEQWKKGWGATLSSAPASSGTQ